MAEGSSSWWKWALGGCLLLALFAACGIGSCVALGGGVWAATEAPAQESKAFLRDLRGGNVEGAYARMSEGYRGANDLAAFQREIETIPALRTHTDDTVTGRSVQNSTAQMTIVLDDPSGARTITIELVEEGDGWAITSVRPL